MLAKEIMTTPVIIINPNAEINELTNLLAEYKISGVPVCNDEGRMVGIVSDSDIRTMKKGEQVKDIMKKEVITVRPDTALEKVAWTMTVHGIKRVPVLDEHNRLVGIISRGDLIESMAIST